MDARNESTYGRYLIIRLMMLVAISVLSYATPGEAVGEQELCVGVIVTIDLMNTDGSVDSIDIRCNGCHNDSDEDVGGCWEGYCCVEDEDGDDWGFDDDGNIVRFTCGLNWSTCTE